MRDMYRVVGGWLAARPAPAGPFRGRLPGPAHVKPSGRPAAQSPLIFSQNYGLHLKRGLFSMHF